jgi:hypothetical protein
MKSIKLFITIIVLLSTACSNNGDNQQVIQGNTNETGYNFKTFSFDTVKNNAQKYTKDSFNKWSELADFFPIYRFSNNRLGIGIEIEDGGNYALTDNFLIQNKDYEDRIVDTLSPFILKKSYKLADAIFNNDTTRFFYIYCTKGVTISKIKDVLYNYEECSALLVLELTPINKAKYGEALIASKQLIDLKYTTLNHFQEDLMVYGRFLKDKSDYKDAIMPMQFAYNDAYFFVYNDDFNWQNRTDKKCLFPSRQIFKKEGNRVKRIWAQGLDLFGIGCD